MDHELKDIDFVITQVKVIDDKIDSVKVHKVKDNGTKIGRGYYVPRKFIADILSLQHNSIIFYTAVKSDDCHNVGDQVVLYDGKYITTAGNSTKRDNLDNLPKFR